MNINLQHDWKDCGLYCLESFYEYYYQDPLDISQLKSITTYGNKGINILELNRTANKIGLKIESYKLNKIELLAYKNKKPFIALINNDGYSHYIIIYKKNKSNYFILDPAKGKYKLSKEKFDNIFAGIILLIEKSGKKILKSDNNSLFKYFIQEKKSIFFLILLLIIISISSIISSYFLKFVVDKVIPSQANKLLNFLFIFFLWLMLVKTTSAFWNNFIKNRVFLLIKIKVKNQLISKFRKGNSEDISKISTIDWFRRLDMVDILIDYYSNLISVITKDILILFISLVFLLSINTQLIYICIFSSLILFCIAIIFKKIKTKQIPTLLNSNLNLNLSYLDILNSHIESKNTNNSRFLFLRNNEKILKMTMQEFKIKSILNWNSFLSECILQMSYLSIIFLGTSQLIQNNISLGNLMLFLSMFTLFSASFSSISNTLLQWTEIKKTTELVNFILNLTSENTNPTGIKIQKINKIELKNVSYEYETGHKIFDIKKLIINKSMNLIGANGSGKTTLLKTLYSYIKYDGTIKVNDVNINNVDIEFFRNKIFFSTNTWLPNISFKNFISNNSNEFEDILKNFEKYKIDKLLLDNNIDISSKISNNGTTLSMGQKKIVTLLPLFAKKYSLILLDEVFENIDIKNQKILSDAILKYQKKAIIIHISHNQKNIFNFRKEYKID